MTQFDTQFDITDADIGRHVRRKSTGQIGIVGRDPGNGWLHPWVVYEWKAYRHDLEYVTVTPDAPMTSYNGNRANCAALVRQAVTSLPAGTLYNSERAIDDIAAMVANAYLLGRLHGKGPACPNCHGPLNAALQCSHCMGQVANLTVTPDYLSITRGVSNE